MMAKHPAYGFPDLVGLVLVTMCYLPSHTTGAQKVIMNQIEKDPRSVGSNVTVVSELHDGCPTAYGILSIMSSDSDTQVAAYDLIDCSNVHLDKLTTLTNYSGLSLNLQYNNLTRVINWNFSNLSDVYSTRALTTTMSVANSNMSSSFILLNVSTCPSPITVPTYQQNSSVRITSQSPGHFNDGANCSCFGEREVLFNASGTRATGTAVCGDDTEWKGCAYVQCWSGPKNVAAEQLYFTVNSHDPFQCNYQEGFPNVTEEMFYLNDVEIPENYILKSYDNGGYLKCSLSSNYTVAMEEEAASRPVEIIVHYPPENSTLSNNSPVIKVNESKMLTFSFSANPESGSVVIKIEESAKENISGMFSWQENSSNNTNYSYYLNVTVRSDHDYGSYNVCASTQTPVGKDCSVLNIYSKDSADEGLSGTVIGVIVVAVVLILVAGIIVYCVRRKKQKTEENISEERINELYGSAPKSNIAGGIYATTNAESGKEEKVNVLYGSAPEHPSSDSAMPTYAQVDIHRKRKGNNNKGYTPDTQNEKSDSAATPQEHNPTAPEVTYAAIDKSKKQYAKEVAGDVYSVVQKPGKKG